MEITEEELKAVQEFSKGKIINKIYEEEITNLKELQTFLTGKTGAFTLVCNRLSFHVIYQQYIASIALNVKRPEDFNVFTISNEKEHFSINIITFDTTPLFGNRKETFERLT